MAELSGVLTAMVTPFQPDGAVDLPGCRKLAAWLLENGSDGLVVTGTTGESPTLDDEEKLAVLREVRAEVGDSVTIIAGTGSNDTRHTVELTARAEQEGADAALIVTPYYNKPNRAGIHAHFEAVAERSGLPLVVYNIPGRCVVNIPPADLAALAAEIETVVALKQANDAELGPIDGMTLLAGNDNVFCDCLDAGGVGGILVASHIVGPQMAELAAAHRDGNAQHARELDDQLQPLYAALAITTNPIPVKTALELLGVCSAHMRLPMVPATEQERDQIRSALRDQGLEVVR